MFHYINYYHYNYDMDDYLSAKILGTLFAGLGVLWLIVMVICVLYVVAQWKIFKKAGQDGWKSLIPIYNSVVLFKIVGISPWLVLVYLAGFIPFIGVFVNLGMSIYVNYKLSKSFGKDAWFTVGLVLLSPIFYLILAFDKSQYIGSYYGEDNMSTGPNPVNQNYNTQNSNVNMGNQGFNNQNYNANIGNQGFNNQNYNANMGNTNVNTINSDSNIQNPNVNTMNSDSNIPSAGINNVNLDSNNPTTSVNDANSDSNIQNSSVSTVNSDLNTQSSSVNNVSQNINDINSNQTPDPNIDTNVDTENTNNLPNSDENS